MKKNMLVVAFAITALAASAADETDSLRQAQLHEVVVSGTLSQKNAPFAVARIREQQLKEFAQKGQELPFLFARTPGVLAWSENGLGTGTTYLRIRGAAASRTNVTLDGVPLNSPEDQCVFWANTNSYASFLGGVQIQRGVGASTNGDGAFGGTVAMMSQVPNEKPMLEIDGSYGSYNTYNVGGRFSTGLLGNHWIVDGAYHETHTDGYIHGTDGRSGSLYGGLAYMTDRFQLRYKNIYNFEKTGQAWNGVTAGNDDLSMMNGTYGQPGFRDYADMEKAGLGRYNSLYERLLINDDYSGFQKDANGNYLTERYQMSNGKLWPRTTDNFWQDHHILTAAANLSDHWKATLSAHYTHGHGYYDEFRYQNKLKKFGLTVPGVKKSDFVRQKGLTQDCYGAVGSVNYVDEKWNVIGGFSAQHFSGNHWGYLTYASNEDVKSAIFAKGKSKYQYYDSDADKTDANVYVKAAYTFAPSWQAFADVQYRFVDYSTDGINDKFLEQADGTYANQRLDISKTYHFFNPKAGISFSQNGHRAYASFAMSHREPERNNFTDNGSYPAPKAERMLDYELGYNYSARTWRVALTGYYMDYVDQFVQTGAQSDIGENLTTNVRSSYRMGLELAAGWDICPLLSIEANAALSQNRIKDFDEVVEDWDSETGISTFHYDHSTLSFSPSAIMNAFIDFHYKGFKATWHTNYVSRQYLDNSENKERSLPFYTASNLYMSYTAQWKCLRPIKAITLGFSIDNIFNRHYASSAWVYSAISESSGHSNNNRYYQIGFNPMSGTTAMAHLSFRF